MLLDIAYRNQPIVFLHIKCMIQSSAILGMKLLSCPSQVYFVTIKGGQEQFQEKETSY